MTTNDKQPTGWVVVDFDAKFDQTFFGKDGWRYAHNACTIQPFDGLGDANVYRSGDEEVHPWPLPASVLARLKAKHPRQDWSQVPVADAPAEKPGRWVIQDTQPDEIGEFRDSIGWRNHASQCLNPWGSKVEASEAAVNGGWRLPQFRVVNLDDLPSPAVAEPSEVERLRARVGWLDMLDTEEGRRTYANEALRVEVEELRGALIECVKACGGGATERVSTEFLMGTPNEVRLCVEKLTRERDDARASVASVSKQLRREADEAIRERDEARAELAKDRLSRRDEFAKAALTGLIANGWGKIVGHDSLAFGASEFADATIRALDGAGGA